MHRKVPKRPSAWRGWRAVIVIPALILAACTSGSQVSGSAAPAGVSTPASSGPTGPATTGPGTTGGGPASTAPVTPGQESRYGYAAQTSGVDYQPGVVVVAGGGGAIRSASDDGLTWTIDKGAVGADQLEVGSVLLMTSHAAGRVAAIQDTGDSRIVTLAPVELTDIIRNGTIDVKQALDPESITFQPIPGLKWAQSTPTDEDKPQRLLGAAGAGAAAVADLPVSQKGSIEVPVGDWKLKPYADSKKLGLGIERQLGGGLKVSVDFAFATENLSISGIDTISNGVSTRHGFTVTGITGMSVSIAAGAERGALDNSKIKLEVPAELNIPIPPSPATAGLPLNIKVVYKFIIETALTGNNATLIGSGKYKLSGPIGIDGGTVQVPTFTVEQSILDSVSGITLGPSGIVIGVSMKFQVGLGTPALTVGPYAEIVTSLGLTNGSSLGAPLARCKGATLDVELGGGAGLSISAAAISILSQFLPKGTKLQFNVGTKTNVLHRAQVVPDVPLCQGRG
jgi:hypothetical protein